jgi:hypothetical protein
MKNKIKLAKLLIWITVAFIILIFSVPIPITIEGEGLEIILENPEHVVMRNVRINGRYHINLFTGNRFYGDITILEHPFTHNDMMYINFVKDPLGYQGSIFYDVENGYDWFENNFGSLYVKFLFKHPIIIVADAYIDDEGDLRRSLSSHESPIIVLGANIRDNALEILERYKLKPFE